jgi:hypothetical protein
MSSSSSLTPEALEQEIATQTTRFNELRLNPDKSVSTPEALNEAKQKLAELKKALALAKNAGKEKVKKEGGVPAAKGREQKKERLLLKTAKVRIRLYDWHMALMRRPLTCRVHATLALRRCSAGNTSSGSSRNASRRTAARASIPPSSSARTC